MLSCIKMNNKSYNHNQKGKTYGYLQTWNIGKKAWDFGLIKSKRILLIFDLINNHLIRFNEIYYISSSLMIAKYPYFLEMVATLFISKRSSLFKNIIALA